ncbi:MAG: hypothetical protein MJ123_08030 [Lachnospiraceae bacterium]|nr:hypothetical protein [Lachnospiraceae bacterium]
MKRKFGLSVILAFAMMFLLTPVSANAAVSDWNEPHEDVLSQAEIAKLSEEEREAYYSSLIRALGYVEFEEDNMYDACYKLQDATGISVDGASSHKSLYDPRKQSLGYKLPAVRDQGSYGTCWAHAAVACLEIDLIKNHKASSSINLSELQLANQAYFHSGKDPVGYLGKDNYYITNFSKGIGGNDTLAANALSMRAGLMDESKYSELAYSNMYNYSFKKLPSKYCYNNQYAVLDNFYTMKNPTKDDIKSAIEKYGAVKVSYYHDFGSASNGKKGAYNNAYGYTSSNHAVCIVGWDDNYSRDNFNHKPSKNGAWIVKNSWGTYTLDQGFMYMSYEESSAQRFSVYDANLASKDYKKIYQYDSVPYTFSNYAYDGYSFANIFTATANDKIGAVQFRGSYNKGATYKVKVYTGCSSSNPVSGKLAATKSGKFKEDAAEATFMISLDSPVSVSKGDKYSVVLELSNGCSIKYGSYGSVGFGSFTMYQSDEVKSGVSFYKSPYSNSYSTYSNNFAIKALANKSGSSSSSELGSFKISTATGSDDGIILKWTQSKNAKGYKVYRDNKVVAKIGKGSVVSYKDKTPKSHEGKLYTYKVVAVNGSKTKAAKAAVKCGYFKPAKITAAKNSSSKALSIKYSKSSKANGYEVVYSTDKKFAKVKTITTKETSVKIKNLTKGKTYYVKVRPYKKSSSKKYYGAWSSVKAIKISK